MKVGQKYPIATFENGPHDGVFLGVKDGGPEFRHPDTGEIVRFDSFDNARPPAKKLKPRPKFKRGAKSKLREPEVVVKPAPKKPEPENLREPEVVVKPAPKKPEPENLREPEVVVKPKAKKKRAVKVADELV